MPLCPEAALDPLGQKRAKGAHSPTRSIPISLHSGSHWTPGVNLSPWKGTTDSQKGLTQTEVKLCQPDGKPQTKILVNLAGQSCRRSGSSKTQLPYRVIDYAWLMPVLKTVIVQLVQAC